MTGSEGSHRPPTFDDAAARHREGRLQEAERAYRALLDDGPDDHRVHYNLGVLLLRSGRPAEALIHLGAAAQADQGRGQNWLTYVEALNASQRYADALQVIARLRQRGFASEALDQLGDVAQTQEDLAATRPGIALPPGLAEAERTSIVAAILAEGDALHGQGELEGALTCYEQAMALQPGSDAACRGAGDALYALGRFEQALRRYDQAHASAPGSPVTLLNRGNTLRVLKRFAEAIECYDAAIALDPDLAMAHHNRALCLLHLAEPS